MIYAQVKNNIVMNTIVLEDPELWSLFKEGYDFCIRIDETDPRPGVGWNFDGEAFLPPIPPEPES